MSPAEVRSVEIDSKGLFIVSPLLQFVEDKLQIAALFLMVTVYIVRIFWLFKFRAVRERSLPEGKAGAGIGYSLSNIALPWAMESTRKNPWFYVQFVCFHLGVTAAISATFIIPYAPRWLEPQGVVTAFQAVMGAALAVGVWRFLRRLRNPALRMVSTPDDYAAILLMIAYFILGIIAVPNRPERGESPMVAFFILTAFFLVYVPFSKISHYLYYPFGRIFLGRTLGRRGVFPVRKPGFGRQVRDDQG
jgi:nitrate reductase gamma subunit